MKKYAIWDLDNCLANDEWRIALIDWKQEDIDLRYQRYHEVCGDDQPGNDDLFHKSVAAGLIPIFLTARPVTYLQQTEAWLSKHFSPLPEGYILCMRGPGDGRSSVECKRQMLREIFLSHQILPQQIIAAHDDRRDVLQMYKQEMVFDVYQTKIHDSCAMTPPSQVVLNMNTTIDPGASSATAIIEGEFQSDSSGYLIGQIKITDQATIDAIQNARPMVSMETEAKAAWNDFLIAAHDDISDFKGDVFEKVDAIIASTQEQNALTDQAMSFGEEEKKTLSDILRDAADDADLQAELETPVDFHTKFGIICSTLFPDSVTITSPEEFNRLSNFFTCIEAIMHYADSFPRGDMQSAAMLLMSAAKLQETTQ